MFFNFRSLGCIHLIGESIDFRRGVVGLNYFLYERGYAKYDVGEVFIFFSKNKKSLKMLYYSKTGFELWHKKLSLGRYKIPSDLSDDYILSKSEFRSLLSGYSILEKGFEEVLNSRVI